MQPASHPKSPAEIARRRHPDPWHRLAQLGPRAADADRLLGPVRLVWVGPLWLLRPTYLVLAGPPRWHEQRTSLPVRWSTLTASDTPRLSTLHPALSPAGISRRLSEGQECLLGWVGERLVHYRWDTSRPALLPYLGLYLRPAADELLTVSAYTAPEFRRRGLHAASTSLVLRRALAHGVQRTISLVAWWNVPALRVAGDQAGRRPVGQISRWWHPRGPRYVTSGTVVLAGPRELQVL